jgi:hypothetical protein
MHRVSVPSELKIGEMVCNDCSESSMVTTSSSDLIFFSDLIFSESLQMRFNG